MDIQRLLQNTADGNRVAIDQLFSAIYEDLHARAKAVMNGERGDHTLQPTALVNETYLRLVKDQELRLSDRTHLFAVAATAMRRVLTDHARRKNRLKRSGGGQRLSLQALDGREGGELDLNLIMDINDRLTELESIDPQRGRIVELRYFGGLEMSQISEVIGVPLRTIERGWRGARAWLHQQLTG